MTALIEVPVTEGIKDFSAPKDPIRFKVDDDIFEASPEISAGLVIEFAEKAEMFDKVNDEDLVPREILNILVNFFDDMLLPESAEAMARRMKDKKNPIGLERLLSIFQWLLGEYGLRPTEPGSPSLDGSSSPDAGTNSTVSAFAQASTSED